MYVGIMPTPWLSWPIRLARTRCSATRSASGAALPPVLMIALVKRRRLSAVPRTRFLPGPQSRLGRPGHAPRRPAAPSRSIPAIHIADQRDRHVLTRSRPRAQELAAPDDTRRDEI